MLDLSATFDCVDHGILLDRLETSFGFSGVVLDWMRSYLVGRRQYARYNGSTSSATVMQGGVPQGSVLIPLYFVLYTADAFRIVGDLGFIVHGYADDLRIYGHCLASDTPRLTNRLIHCIEIVGRWMSSNRHRRRNSSGWVRHVVWQDVPSIQPPSAEKLYNHRKRFAISERILTPLLVSPSMSPGW